jgi:branched-chain amino acid transport system ATP-binding protein
MCRKGVASFARMSVAKISRWALSRLRPTLFRDLEFVLSLFPALKARLSHPAGPFRRRAANAGRCARAHEPSEIAAAGRALALACAPYGAADFRYAIRHLRQERGTTILLVEQNAFQALKLADRAM